MAGALRGRAAAAVAAVAGGAGFAYWDATDKRGGVGVTRAAAATATAALIVADYKWSLRGLAKDSPPFQEARHGVHERSAARLLTLCERNGGLYTKAGQFISTASGMPVPFQQQLGCRFRPAADWEDVRDVVVAELGAGAMANLVPGDVPGTPSSLGTSPRDTRRVSRRSTADPVAAASRKVHRAVTSAGEEVAVKVQRPDSDDSSTSTSPPCVSSPARCSSPSPISISLSSSRSSGTGWRASSTSRGRVEAASEPAERSPTTPGWSRRTSTGRSPQERCSPWSTCAG